jgi:hypothetical protein
MDDRELAAFERDLRAFRPRTPRPLPGRPANRWVPVAVFLGLAAAGLLVTVIPHLLVKSRPSVDVDPVIGYSNPVVSYTTPDVSLAALRRAARGDGELARVLDAAAPRLLRAVGGEDARAR